MSQHIALLECGKAQDQVRVQLGWDKPMAEYYLVVFAEEDIESDDEEGEPSPEEVVVYSNLDDPRGSRRGLDYFRKVADYLGCEIPEVMWQEAYADRESNVINRIVYYSASGEVIDPF